MSEKFIFVINPKAGKNNRAMNFINKIEAACKAFGIDSEIYITKAVGDAREFVKERCKDLTEATRFYACGGDGTINEVINGAVGFPYARVGLLPLGSGNDYIKAFPDVDFLDLPAQIKGTPKAVDLIRIGDRYVANMCNIGFDATVAHNFVKFKTFPGVSGKMAYTLSVFYCLVNKISSPMTIVLDNGTEIHDNMLLCSVSKGIYCGGQYKTAPMADLSDGFMDVCPIKKISRSQFLKFFSLYKVGNHVNNPELEKWVSYHKCKKMTIKSSEKLPVCFDGDTAFLDGTVTFELVPNAIEIIIPAAGDEIDKAEKTVAQEVM
ncbi:MAG: diacylglycerol kinase family protein [Oscillospiraceae bacterium]|nr:diacylglycerol kinase family protein [Oscillospiraceae bacterium]